MNGRSFIRGLGRGLRRGALVGAAIAAVLVLVALGLVFYVSRNMADEYIRQKIVTQVSKLTGRPVELREFRLNFWHLGVTLGDFTIHGREPAGAPPFFHVDRLQVGVRIDSFWGRKISVGDVELLHPQVYVRIARDGSSNVPTPPRNPNGKPIRERLFQVIVHRLRLEDGQVAFNDTKIPLSAQGGRLDLAVDYSTVLGSRQYLGDFRWQRMILAARNYREFPSDIGVRFILEPDSLTVTQLSWAAPHTNLDAQFTLAGFAQPKWSFRYRGRLGLEDLQTILRKAKIPSGRVDFLGNGRYADGKLAVTGGYSASGIGIHDPWFHVDGMSSRGTIHADRNVLDVPDLRCDAMGGFVTGKLRLELHGLRFRVDAHAQNVDLPLLLAGVNNPNFPVTLLHWDSSVDVQSVVTWLRDFKDVDSVGVATWTPHAQTPAHLIPAHAKLNYHYNMLGAGVTLESSEIDTPSSRMDMEGELTAHGTGLTATFDAQDLIPWDDFINYLRGAHAPPKVIAGAFHWQGQMTGAITGPTFIGHVRGTGARYDRLYWDEVEGNMSYSPQGFTLTGAQARRGRSSAQLEISMTLDDWNFRPQSAWSVDATLVRTDMQGLESLLGYDLPVNGLLSGQFHGKGTRADPTLDGLFDIISPEAWSWKFDRLRGELSLHHGEVRVSNAELRMLPPPTKGSSVPGLLTGNFLYRTGDAQTVFNLTGASLPLEGIEHIQTSKLKIGGRLNFQLSGDGPLLAPKVQGSLRLVDLRLNSDVIGSFAGRLESDSRQMMLQVDSAMSTGSLHGNVMLTLGGAYPISSQLTLAQINLNPLLAAGLHLPGITGTGQADGQISLSGALLDPQTLDVKADLSHLAFDFQYVQLENEGPVRLEYGHSTVQVSQANFRGQDTDFHLTGTAGFAGDRRINMQFGGRVNLGLIGGFVTSLDARGPAQVDATIAGTLSAPRITGRVHLQDAGVRYGDFPAGLSALSGDMVFDTNRLVFDNLTATTGGGQLRMTGAVAYGNGPLRYDLTVRSEQVRIRYPIGMSWLAGGSLQLSGTRQGATLSGSVTVDRLLLGDNFDVVSLLGSSAAPIAAPDTASAFLRNLQFDVAANTSPNARLEWSSGNSQTDANIRIRGTWDRPIMLGNIQLLGGRMDFRGNRYTLSRGDINFVNPFRLDPELDIEATTRIRQYQVTIDFSGQSSHLTMSYRSDPPLPSSDIITLLALGQTGEQTQLRGVTPVETPGVGATTLLSEAISSQLGTRVQRLFGISRFSLDPSYLDTTTSTQNPGARVTIEQTFSGNLSVLYSTDVTSTQEEVIQIEYAIRPDLSVVALRDDNGTFGVDIIKRKRFK